MMSQFSTWKTIGYAVAIFVAGGISGGALGIYHTRSSLLTPPRAQEMELHIRNRLRARLGLSPDQVDKINPIIQSAAENLRAIHIETAQRVNKVFEDSFAQVSAILTPEQREKLNEMQRERHEMMARWQETRHHSGLAGPNGNIPRDDLPAPSAP
jgi:hypothetical protein